MANSDFFYNVVQGEFGRQTPYYKAENDIIDDTNVLDALSATKKTFEKNTRV